ncbi:MFS transporter [Paraburkholderia sp. CNPSo 3274]|uniref:MFS transporter n=1 Tax=Paraburkholderia sp. CNPSo 3274 TaxID=2940932 RepID=UPI0020B73F62|nr:MFS transporter [Paraburkholderia sp. CNPSo 3274]MCP3712713.1 MFS transporter [Paraburkholderia sp. CNPSo 3274]
MHQASDLWADRPMTGRQIMVIAMCCILNAFDGIDILAISFASPGIAAEWAINKAELGVVLSMELIGMTIGSALFGYLADRRGRRFVVLSCLMVTTLGMWAATQANSVSMLSMVRFATGLGIGGMIATAHSTASEFANAKRRNLVIACVGLGWPIGAIVGGSIAAEYVSLTHWRHLFIAGATISTAFLPVAWFALPESVSYLIERQPRNALQRANKVLAFLGHAQIARLPSIGESSTVLTSSKGSMLYGLTAALATAYFFDCMTYYFLLKWSPKIVTDLAGCGNTSRPKRPFSVFFARDR